MMANNHKRSFQDLSDIEVGVASELHCAIECVSPVKKSRNGVNYYTGTATDGKRKARLVGFDE